MTDHKQENEHRLKKRASGGHYLDRAKQIRTLRKAAVVLILAAVAVSLTAVAVSLVFPRASEPEIARAAILDHLSLTFPNPSFIGFATEILEQAGYMVDYYPGDEVTVDLYRHLPEHDYSIIILRVHSSATELEEGGFAEAPVIFFTAEPYSPMKHVSSQLAGHLVAIRYTMPESSYYFGIPPEFIAGAMKGRLRDTTVIMLGCEGLKNSKMAEAFIRKGAGVYIGWDELVSVSRTDQATLYLLAHLLLDNQTIKEAVENTMNRVGPDLAHDSVLLYYPP